MYNIWCEWDVGQEGLIFSTKKKAQAWLENNDNLKECYEEIEGCDSVADLINNEGLVGINKLVVDQE